MTPPVERLNPERLSPIERHGQSKIPASLMPHRNGMLFLTLNTIIEVPTVWNTSGYGRHFRLGILSLLPLVTDQDTQYLMRPEMDKGNRNQEPDAKYQQVEKMKYEVSTGQLLHTLRALERG
ncbi:hypothetical protein GX51_05432 [Blastomyces parvus]|uniref:Uncharacterized protein n=1 Tax=Blastomyces parvus TaxID=2060905 RepID=A0A2B7WWD8_9EURO|nr:hypothetical protein GX51_05432 [Blastomyces parvus]